MNLPIGRNIIIFAPQQKVLPPKVDELGDIELARLAKSNKEARDYLVLKNLDTVKQAAKYISYSHDLRGNPEELESDALIKLLAPETWEKYDLKRRAEPKHFISIVSMNAIRDELRKDGRQRRFLGHINEQNLNSDQPYLIDPMSENLNKKNDLPELEEMKGEFLRSLHFIYTRGINTGTVQKIIELSYGIDLGTNREREQLKAKEITNLTGVGIARLKSLKFRFNQILKRRLIDSAA